MTTPNEAKEAIYSRFITEWGGETAYVFGNEEFDSPEATGASAASWVRLLVKETPSGGQETLGRKGSRQYRRRGQIIMMIYALPDKGEQRADELARIFRDAFEGESFSGIDCFDCQVIESGNEGLWYRVNAFVEMTFSETK